MNLVDALSFHPSDPESIGGGQWGGDIPKQ
jgi:hypothetical protein